MTPLKLALASGLIALAIGGTAQSCNTTSMPSGPTNQAPIQPGQTVYDGDGIHVECDNGKPTVIRPLNDANIQRGNQVCGELQHDYQILQSVVNSGQ